MKKLLHVGCGPKSIKETTNGFNNNEWSETRFDIDESVSPDVIGSMTDMTEITNEEFDAIFSSHNIEHLYVHEVPIVLGEFFRVLNDKGFIVITCPDLKSVCKLIAEDKLLEPAYESPAGPISPIDILYGYRPSIASGNLFMSHRCGFTQKVLSGTLKAAGFKSVATYARSYAPFFDLWAIASKCKMSDEDLLEVARVHFPS